MNNFIFRLNPSLIKKIDNPTEEQQLIAVKRNPKNIQYIHNPSEEVQLVAVKKNGGTIQYIHNPSEKVQLAAVKKNADAIMYIDNPSEKVQLVAVEKNGYLIKYIEDPSDDVIDAAMRQNPESLLYVDKELPRSIEDTLFDCWETGGIIASEEYAYKRYHPNVFRFIKHPSKYLQIKVAKAISYCADKSIIGNYSAPHFEDCRKALLTINERRNICAEAVEIIGVYFGKYMSFDGFAGNPDDRFNAVCSLLSELEIDSVECGCVLKRKPELIECLYRRDTPESILNFVAACDGRYLRFIPRQTEELQLIAVKNTPEAIKYLKNPTQKVIKECLSRDACVPQCLFYQSLIQNYKFMQ